MLERKYIKMQAYVIEWVPSYLSFLNKLNIVGQEAFSLHKDTMIIWTLRHFDVIFTVSCSMKQNCNGAIDRWASL